MTFKEFDNLIQRYIHNNCTESERQLVEKWFASMEKDDREVLAGPERNTVENRLWAKVTENESSKLPKQRFMSGWQISGIAASLLLVAVSLFMLVGQSDLSKEEKTAGSHTEDQIRIDNTSSTVRIVALEDGSVVSLEPGSELHYTAVFSAENREVYLTGEAFFEVAEDKYRPFLVYSSGITTRVLGTTFRVKAYEEDKEVIVSVSTGKVSVFRQSDQNSNDENTNQLVILTPNQQAVYNKREDIVATSLIADPQIVLTESTLKSHYYNIAVADIFETLEKNYGIDIEFNEEILSGCSLTTTLADESLYEKMEIICQVIGAQYTVHGTTLVVESQGCD